MRKFEVTVTAADAARRYDAGRDDEDRDDPDSGYYDPTTDDGTTFYGEGLTLPSYGD